MDELNLNSDSDEVLLKKIDLVRERTDLSYRQAKEALERNGGNVLQTLIEYEELQKTDAKSDGERNKWTEEFTLRSGEVIGKVKELIHQGNVTKIRIKHDGKVLADIPISLGAIGAVVLPQLAALGVLVAVFKQCTMEVVREEEPRRDDRQEENKMKNEPF